MGEAAKGEGFSSSLVYALIKISACGTIVRSTRKKFVRVEINFYTFFFFFFTFSRSNRTYQVEKKFM